MSTHIKARKGEIAKRVILTGDPVRATYIAENYLKEVHRYNSVRNMYGYTGYYKTGRRISVQGSGMGQSSLSIYVNELIDSYEVREIVRVGTCGALQENMALGEIVIAQCASTDSNMVSRRFKGWTFAAPADWALLMKAWAAAHSLNLAPPRVGNILATDVFYDKDEEWRMWAKYGVLAVEMESAELYTLAAEKGVRALTILSVSDCLWDRSLTMPAEDRAQPSYAVVQLALAATLI